MRSNRIGPIHSICKMESASKSQSTTDGDNKCFCGGLTIDSELLDKRSKSLTKLCLSFLRAQMFGPYK